MEAQVTLSYRSISLSAIAITIQQISFPENLENFHVTQYTSIATATHERLIKISTYG